MKSKKYVILSADEFISVQRALDPALDDKHCRTSIYSVGDEIAKMFLSNDITQAQLIERAYEHWKNGCCENSFDKSNKKAIEYCKIKNFEILMNFSYDIEKDILMNKSC